MKEVNYEPWADLHKPQNFHRTDPTGRSEGLYIGEHDWSVNWNYVLYGFSVLMLVILAVSFYI